MENTARGLTRLPATLMLLEPIIFRAASAPAQLPKKLGSIKQGVTFKMTNQFKVMSLNKFPLLPFINDLEFWLLIKNPVSLASMRLRACSHDPGTTHCPGATH